MASPSKGEEATHLPWERPSACLHAHFDCFSGAAGDMMLAACLDASGNEKAPRLLRHVQECLEKGLPELKDEFSIDMRRVWRSKMGSIAATYILVQSKYNHAAAPVPKPASPADASAGNTTLEEETPAHSHSHGHGHSHEHESQKDHSPDSPSNAESHSHENDHAHNETDENPSHDHSHSHSHSRGNDHPEEKNSSHDHSHERSHGTEETLSHDHSHSHGHDHSNDASSRGPLRNLPQIRKMLLDASTEYIPTWVKDMGILTFEALAIAEAATHGASSADAVHFHEVGAIDSIVDTVGTLLALYSLGVTTVSCSRLPLGEGTVWTDHGLLPVPAPATLRLLVDMATCPGPMGITGELVTPTAAALLKVLTKHSNGGNSGSRPPCFTLRQVGIGAGTKDFLKHPNILRLMIGDGVSRSDKTN